MRARALRRARLTLPLVALVLLASAACNSDDNSTTVATPTVAATAAAATASSATPAGAKTTAATATAAATACSSPAITPSQTEGPYFTADSPERSSLIDDGMAGTRLRLTGVVVTADCEPVANAVLDFWQADAAGAYDNNGYTLRGRQTADANGRFRLETIVPGEYPGRTPHIHVKVQAPGRDVLTTQLYLDNDSNANDGIFDSALVMDATTTADGVDATFTFVLAAP